MTALIEVTSDCNKDSQYLINIQGQSFPIEQYIPWTDLGVCDLPPKLIYW